MFSNNVLFVRDNQLYQDHPSYLMPGDIAQSDTGQWLEIQYFEPDKGWCVDPVNTPMAYLESIEYENPIVNVGARAFISLAKLLS